jgi:hypothetical protein
MQVGVLFLSAGKSLGNSGFYAITYPDFSLDIYA